MNSLKSLFLCGAFLSAVPLVTHAQVADPNQSSARPHGMDIVGQVNQGGSDTASAAFQSSFLPGITSLMNTQLGESRYLADANAHAVDPSKLTLATDYTARVYFVGEGAGYHNTLGFNTIAPNGSTPAGGMNSSAQIIFPDASSSVSTLGPSTTAHRSASAPLLPGDFADLGTFAAGSSLDFFLVSNGANGGRTVLTDSAARNPDHINHVVAFAQPNSPYLILAFEDLVGGGDRDYNDLVIALDIGVANVQRLVSAPEPATWGILAAFLGLAFWQRRRRPSMAAPAAAAA